ncbi:unnamed protein product [Mytilus edulis]|uniref:Poly [ADP-ribose] polymerase n=1 Tax=Mytilus edulis TaxID=6550 RepID=A0A8S3QP34_MYTED|nr:unnamed protein product [Mytilus edulis]
MRHYCDTVGTWFRNRKNQNNPSIADPAVPPDPAVPVVALVPAVPTGPSGSEVPTSLVFASGASGLKPTISPSSNIMPIWTKSTVRFTKRWTRKQTSDNLQIVPLNENSNEYKIVKKSFEEHNRNFEIVEIRRVQNRRLYEAHISFENTFMDTAKQQYPYSYMRYLWHGTENSSDNINQYGFNRNYQGKNACRYGDGVYFATEPRYSSRDTYSVPDSRGYKRFTNVVF